jgi:FkbM family methyltransferase
MGQVLDFIEIGTSDFNTILESCSTDQSGISVEPLKFYLDSLPDKPNVQKVNAALVYNNLVTQTKMYYVSPENIEKYDLGWWLKGCNTLETPHDFHLHYPLSNEDYNNWHSGNKNIQSRNLLEEGLVEVLDVPCITYSKLLKEYNVDYVDHIKIDTEGHDAAILNSILDYYTYSKKQKPKSILFETNEHNDQQKSLEVCYRLIDLGYTLKVGHADWEGYQDFNNEIFHDCLATL